MKKPNRLINQTSPYLQQHAYNPVDWYPWGEEAWQRARAENKLVLVSIGYSSCHWCHVMERECFEDPQVAELMNEHFINIKVDREERPDVDQVYMLAVQLMTGSGGWPLNCITLPDGRPVFGGTYFPRNRWIMLLQQLAEYYRSQPEDALDFAHRITDTLGKLERPAAESGLPASLDTARQIYSALTPQLDVQEGGFDRAPKFPLPNSLMFLLYYSAATNNPSAANHVLLTLRKMALGGIYDQLAGGFARYSTDPYWKVPHFEKMLYDNAQLISLYAQAYRYCRDPLFRTVAEETFAFVTRELMSDGAFCAALDADSEWEEGRYYVWTRDELVEVLGDSFPLAEAYYNINDYGHWEDGKYVLVRREDDAALAQRLGISVAELQLGVAEIRQRLLQARHRRQRPLRDQKEITSWSALMIKACCAMYDAWGDDAALRLALQQGERNWKHFIQNPETGYAHSRMHGMATSPGFLDDYAFSADAFISIYQSTFDEVWLQRAYELVQFAERHYYDSASGMYCYTAASQQPLIVRMTELGDDVLPSSNSVMAQVLLHLGRYRDEPALTQRARNMLQRMLDNMVRFPLAYSNWAILLLEIAVPPVEVVIVGEKALQLRRSITENFLPFALLAGSTDGNSSLPLLQHRYVAENTYIYVCSNNRCLLPVTEPAEALQQLKAVVA